MMDWTLLLNQFPLLLVGLPLCGIVSIGLISLIGHEHLPRTFLLNGLLTFGCALVILFQFQFGTERTRLSPADSFQSVIELSRAGSPSGFRFGVDGCSLPLVLLTSALPLFAGFAWRLPGARGDGISRKAEMTGGRAALVLLLQTLLLIFLTALDRRVQLVTLLLSTCVLLIVLSVSSPTGRRIRSNRWQRQLLLSDFLIGAGILGTLTPLVRLAGLGNAPALVFDLGRLLEAVELLRDEALAEYVRLMLAATPAVVVLLVGCSLRFGMFPCSGAARAMWQDTAPWQRLLIWVHGPLLGTAVVLRELQAFPAAAYQVVTWLKYLWLPGLFLSAVAVRLSTESGRDAALLVYFSSLLLFSLVGPNPVSLAGSFLLLIGIGLRLSSTPVGSTAGSAICYLRSASRFFMSAGVVCMLIGEWQGLGAGSRGLGFSLAAGLSLLIPGTSGQRDSRRTQRSRSGLLSPPSVSSAAAGERPVWDVSPAAAVPVAVGRRRIWRAAGLIAAACGLLMLPDFLWQRIRWDVQKIEFPRGEISLSAGEAEP